MRIGVFSDSHGRISNIKYINVTFDAILHLGDYAEDAIKNAEYFNCPYFCVRGNCDSYRTEYPKETVVTFEGIRLLLTHGHTKRTDLELGLSAEQENCSAVLYGHTHTPSLSAYGKILLINPGSLSEPRYCSKPGYSILIIENGELNVKMRSIPS